MISVPQLGKTLGVCEVRASGLARGSGKKSIGRSCQGDDVELDSPKRERHDSNRLPQVNGSEFGAEYLPLPLIDQVVQNGNDDQMQSVLFDQHGMDQECRTSGGATVFFAAGVASFGAV